MLLPAILSSLLFLLVSAEWAIPEQLLPKIDFFSRVTGYSPFLGSFYPRVGNTTPIFFFNLSPRPLLSPSETRFECSILEESSVDVCVTHLEASFCSNSSLFSVAFHQRDGVISCEKEGREVDCASSQTSLDASLCRNLVEAIGSRVRQTTERVGSSGNCTSYVVGETLRGESASLRLYHSTNTECAASLEMPLRFGEDVQFACEIETRNRTCDNLRREVEEYHERQVNETRMCNCEECEVPILRHESRGENNDSLCELPTQLQIIVVYQRNAVIGFVKRAIYEVIDLEESLGIVTRVRFVQGRANDRRRFDLQRGRFHCPSEVSCWMELLYPLHILDFSTSKGQLLLFFFFVVLPISVWVSPRPFSRLTRRPFSQVPNPIPEMAKAVN